MVPEWVTTTSSSRRRRRSRRAPRSSLRPSATAVAARAGHPPPSSPRRPTPPALLRWRRMTPRGGGPCSWSASPCSHSSASVTPRRRRQRSGRSARRLISSLVSSNHRFEPPFARMECEISSLKSVRFRCYYIFLLIKPVKLPAMLTFCLSQTLFEFSYFTRCHLELYKNPSGWVYMLLDCWFKFLSTLLSFKPVRSFFFPAYFRNQD